MTVSRTFGVTFGLLALAVLVVQGLVFLSWDESQADDRRVALHEAVGRTLARSASQVAADAGEQALQRSLDEAGPLPGAMTARWVKLDQRVTTVWAPKVASNGIPKDSFSASTVELGSERLFISYTPARLGSDSGAIEIAEPVGPSGARRPEFAHLLLADTALIVALFALAGWLLGRRVVSRPLGSLVSMARRVGGGDLSARVSLTQKTELGQLGDALNSMASSLERQTHERDAALAQARHADRLATLGQLAAGLAHELGTPLNVVQGRARTLQSGDLEPPAVEHAAAEIIGETERMAGLVRQFLAFSGKRGGTRVRVDLPQTIEHTLTLLQTIAAKRGITLRTELQPATVMADATQLQQVVTNLALNAIQASSSGGSVEVSVRPERDQATLSVRDRGGGLSDEVQKHLFEPFFTTRPPGEGTGLGLAVTFGIVRELGGEIAARNADGGGALFEVTLPLAPKETT